MDRRTFIKLTAITGTSATLAGCGVPEHQIIRFVPDDELVPGIAEYKPGVCPLCAAGCGLSVRTMMADVDTTREGKAGVVRMSVAKKLEGQEKHPVSRGGLCARGQAAIQARHCRTGRDIRNLRCRTRAPPCPAAPATCWKTRISL